MNQEVSKILSELYQWDPTLKQNHETLEKIVDHMLHIKPKVVINEDFKNSLKTQIDSYLVEKKIQQYNKTTQLSWFQKLSYFVWIVWMACFAFVIFKWNILDNSYVWTKPKMLVTPENAVVQEEVSEKQISMEASILPNEEKNEVNTAPTSSPLRTEEKKLKTDVVESSDSQVAESKAVHSDNESTKVDDVVGTSSSDTSVASDAVWWNMLMSDESVQFDESSPSLWLMKSAPNMAEYVQDVYMYSFSWDFNIDINGEFDTFTKTQNTSYFLKQNLALERSKENILSIASKWWKDGYNAWPESQKKREVKVVLKNPKLAYNNIYHFANGISYEYFAPCVVFEVDKELSDNNYYANEVVVPLIKEIYTYDAEWKITWVKQ